MLPANWFKTSVTICIAGKVMRQIATPTNVRALVSTPVLLPAPAR